MAAVIKLKRSEVASAVPSSVDLATGEVAINTADKAIYVKDSAGQIVQIANYAVADQTLIFPTSDYGDLQSSSLDAFGQAISVSFDCLTTPAGAVSTTDLGSL